MTNKPDKIEDVELPPLGDPVQQELIKKAEEVINSVPNAETTKPHEAVVGVFKSVWNWIKSF